MAKQKNNYFSLKNKENADYKIIDVIWLEKFERSKCLIFCKHCNKEKMVGLRRLWYGTTKSCGCLRKLRGLNKKSTIDLSGKKFGLLIAIKPDENNTGRMKWICKCECGRKKSILAKHLVNGNSKSCGHGIHKSRELSWAYKGHKELSGKYWETTRKNAIKRELDFTVSIEYAWDLFIKQEKRCAVTGLSLEFNTSAESKDGNASLDRIDSSKGYVEGNIQWVDKKVNAMKWDLTMDDFFKVCKKVVDFNKL